MKENKVIKAGIVGISGYSGGELLSLLLDHPGVRITYVSANNTTGPVSEIWPHLTGRTKLTCEKFDLKKAVENCDLVFLAVPHTVAITIAPHLLSKGTRVIDLSGDYRLQTGARYLKWYGTAHTDPRNLKKAVYGLPELYREKIKKAMLVSNPGCYPTAAILALAPLVSAYGKAVHSIIIDAKSGVSGAGKKAKVPLIFPEVSENFKAYKVTGHQHTPEIGLYLSRLAGKAVSTTFVPHLLPVCRGILETIYISPGQEKINANRLHTLYRKFYKTEPFVRVLAPGQQPELKNVSRSNYCDIGLAVNKDTKTIIITSAIDNLVKGAAGQAVQNMNIMYGFHEQEALGGK